MIVFLAYGYKNKASFSDNSYCYQLKKAEKYSMQGCDQVNYSALFNKHWGLPAKK